MRAKQLNNITLLGDLYRQEYLKMIAMLCHHFGLEHIEIAEDIIGETFLKASENWAITVVPENPAAWLYTVAKNKAKDHLKRVTLFDTKIVANIKHNITEAEPDVEFEDEHIGDSQLTMVFAVCDPANSTESQICLALQILCGFTVEEIANAFLTGVETIKKRLHRARTALRNNPFQIRALSEPHIMFRLDTVLKTLYLLFNEGYFSKTNDQLIRNELCAEAIRLALVLTENPITDTAQTKALLALMCYQSSRIEARTNNNGEVVIYDDQDQNRWNKDLIEKGNYYLVNACQGNQVSKYHLEAGIAYWHTNPAALNKWQHILQLYNQLILIAYSPVIALNRAFAIAMVYGNEKAILETEKLKLATNDHYHKLLGYLYETVDLDKAIEHYSLALQYIKTKAVKNDLIKKIEQLKR
ncbi:RNA polymerase sigma factor [Mucilaginibacter sp. Mucisp86]|uniref:RNA polymerase sigma factor n=1 Tax=Mucilaginibacter sp. Mucisp86 TaxID=3243060 RepID=UPI0039B5C5C0